MKFSIITPSFAQGQYVRQNIESVLSQGIGELEHIVVDGGSKDETVEILRSYPHLKWVSEKDEGQADALSKGLRMATGDIVGWINSDDYYLEGALKKVAELFADPAIQWVIGDISVFDEASGEFIASTSPEISWDALQRNPDIVRQQGAFFRRDFLLQAGGWNKEFYMVMDFDLWTRLAKRSKPVMLREQLAVFRIQKNQKSGLANLHRQTNEITRVLKREKADPVNILGLRIKKEWQWLKGTTKVQLIRAGLLTKKAPSPSLSGSQGS
ncbi:glycosyltransferase family 2 protein [Ferribacterium limneticum]|uniref:glycosyltransferase family 2 protein n=1 Tax=Ferribacterium limneticum TaxID=76259 RepID=UPI001CFC2DFC|nr:glycosyltransferase family 2 protein [Ferribacterium limneticum]UCV29980.1 glycosyltransferase [Ferribacterium limneticum]UCV33899.1 glycosyltransferase [Ferribacterium limneticum]